MDSPILSQPIKFVPEYRAIIMKRLLFIFTFCFAPCHSWRRTEYSDSGELPSYRD